MNFEEESVDINIKIFQVGASVLLHLNVDAAKAEGMEALAEAGSGKAGAVDIFCLEARRFLVNWTPGGKSGRGGLITGLVIGR